MKKRTGKPEWEPDWKRIGFGTGVGVIAMLAMAGLGAWLLDRELVGLEWVNYLSALILTVASFLAAKTAGASLEQWPGASAAGGGLWLILLLIHVLGFGGGLESAGPTALAILGGTGAAILLSGGGKRHRNHSRRRRNR